MAAAKPNQHGYRGVSTKWTSGNLQFSDTSGNAIMVLDATNRKIAGINMIGNGAAVAETYAATVSIDTTKGFHRIAGSNATAAASTFNASTTGNDGDELMIEVTSDSGGTCTITFGTHFKPSGTLAVTLSHYASVWFISDGTNWKEQGRSAIIAS
jgi:hypothetical protein